MTTDENHAQSQPDIRVRLRDVAVAIAAIALGAALWVGAGGLPQILVQTGQPGAGFWPRLLAGGLVGLGALLCVWALLGRTGDVDVEPANPDQRLPLLFVVGVLIVYLVAWPLVGFLPSTFVAFAVLSKVMGTTRWWRAVLWSAVLTAAVWLLFAQFLQVAI